MDGIGVEELKAELEKELRGTLPKLKKLKIGYSTFEKMLDEKGAYITVKELICNPNLSGGLIDLLKVRRLDLSLEYIILKDKYKPLFEDDENYEDVKYINHFMQHQFQRKQNFRSLVFISEDKNVAINKLCDELRREKYIRCTNETFNHHFAKAKSKIETKRVEVIKWDNSIFETFVYFKMRMKQCLDVKKVNIEFANRFVIKSSDMSNDYEIIDTEKLRTRETDVKKSLESFEKNHSNLKSIIDSFLSKSE